MTTTVEIVEEAVTLEVTSGAVTAAQVAAQVSAHNSSATAHGLTTNISAALAAAENPSASNPLLTAQRTQSGDGVQATIIRAIPFDPDDHGAWFFEIDNNTYLSTKNPIMTLGYNLTLDEIPMSGEQGFAWRIEADWEFGSGTRALESYWVYVNPAGTFGTRPIHFYADLQTDDTQLFLRSANIYFEQPTADALNTYTRYASLTALTAPRFVLYGNNSYESSVRVNGGAGQAGAIYLGFDNDDDVFHIAPISATRTDLFAGTQVLHYTSTVSGIAAFGLGIGMLAAEAQFCIITEHTGLAAIQVAPKSGQTAGLIRAKVGSAYPWQITKDGHEAIAVNAAPADADVATGALQFWYDSTNGAGKLMIKAKTADGTVVTGEVALA